MKGICFLNSTLNEPSGNFLRLDIYYFTYRLKFRLMSDFYEVKVYFFMLFMFRNIQG